jgi:hypothetical protein
VCFRCGSAAACCACTCEMAAAATTTAVAPRFSSTARATTAGPRSRGLVITASAQQRHSELSYSQPHGRSGSGSGATSAGAIFDSFWRARGVADDTLRAKLVADGQAAIRQTQLPKTSVPESREQPTSWLLDAQEGHSQVQRCTA